MNLSSHCQPLSTPLAQHLQAHSLGVSLYWLGQAGFVIQSGARRIVIDPYLSDYLAQKYEGQPLAHQRMAQAPISVEGLGQVDLVLCTHHHSDHMDPLTLAPMAQANPHVSFVVPRASMGEARNRIGVTDARLLPIEAGEQIEALPGVWITATRACHETLERDELGNHRFLGYLIDIEGVRIFHSGDTIPYQGQIDEIRALHPDIALLPVNGRSAELSASGVPGNLNLEEAVKLCQDCEIPFMIAHHFGLFAFNTADPETIDDWIPLVMPLKLMRAQLHTRFHFTQSSTSARPRLA